MADQTTSWILELIDHITKPIKSIVNSVKGATNSVDDLTDTVKLSEKETREALGKSKQYYKELEGQIKEVEKELKDLEKVKKNGDWQAQMEAAQAFDKATQKVGRLREALQGAEDDVKDLTTQVDVFEVQAQKWTDVATGINQGIELIQKATDGLDFSVDVQKLQTQVARMTDLSGKDLDEFVKKSRRLANVYDEDAIEIARSANAMTKQNGKSFQENLDLIESGYKKGANANGDFIDQLKEYQPFIKQLGLDQSEAIALIAKSGKAGIFSDKAIDSIKEADLSLREMGKGQVDALKGIGMTPDDLVGKTTFEAIQMIATKMKGATSQAKQLILADIFKGAGEDAGLAWASELGSMDLDITKLASVEEAGVGIKSFFSDISTWAGQAFGGIGIYATELSPMIQTVAGIIPIYEMLSKVTWLQNIATNALAMTTKFLGLTIMGTPIGWILAGIALIVGAIMWLSENTTGWGEAWDHVWNAAEFMFKGFVSGISTYFNTMINGLMIGLNKIKGGWYEFKEAVGLGDSAENQQMIEQINADTNARKESIKEGIAETASYAIKAAAEMAAAVGSVKVKKDDETASNPSINEYATGSPDLLGNYAPTDKKGKGKKEGDGINVGGGSGGIKSIVMTLNIENKFSVSKGTDTRSLADQIVGHVNDKMRDAVINLGG